MCGRFLLDDDPNNLAAVFDASAQELPFSSEKTATPGMMIPVIRTSPDGKREILPMRWGLIPSWAKDPKIGYKMFNARSETIQSKPSFAAPFRRSRCLIPASGFYEWDHSGKTPVPYIFTLTDTHVFSFAGLYDQWKDPEGHTLLSCTVITTAPNSLIAPIHDRMPVILPHEYHTQWLSGNTPETDLLPLLTPYPSDAFSMQKVT